MPRIVPRDAFRPSQTQLALPFTTQVGGSENGSENVMRELNRLLHEYASCMAEQLRTSAVLFERLRGGYRP